MSLHDDDKLEDLRNEDLRNEDLKEKYDARDNDLKDNNERQQNLTLSNLRDNDLNNDKKNYDRRTDLIDKLERDEKRDSLYQQLEKDKIVSGDKLSVNEIRDYASKNGLSPNYVAQQIFNIKDKTWSSAIRDVDKNDKNRFLEVRLNADRTVEDLKGAEKAREIVRDELKLGQKVDRETLDSISKRADVRLEVLLKDVFGKNDTTYIRLNSSEDSRNHISSIKYTELKEENRIKEPFRQPDIPRLSEDEKRDALPKDREYYDVKLNDKNDKSLEDLLRDKARDIQNDRDILQDKLNSKYEQIKDSFLKDKDIQNMREDRNYYLNIRNEYLKEVKEVVERMPIYKDGIDKDNMERMAQDFKMSTRDFGAALTGKEAFYIDYRYERDGKILISQHEKIPMPNIYAETKFDELKDKCDKISTVLHRDNQSIDRQELSSQMFSTLYERGGKVIYDVLEKGGNIRDVSAALGGYAKATGTTLLAFESRLNQVSLERNYHGEKINDEKNSYLKDNSRNTEQEALNRLDDEDKKDIKSSILESPEYLEKLESIAKQSGLSIDEVMDMVRNA